LHVASAALQGLTNFERLEGILSGEPVDAQKAKKTGRMKSYVVRRQMDGKDSGLSAVALDLLRILDEMYGAETHGPRISLSQSTEWFKGKQPLTVTPAFSEFKASIFINCYLEVAGWHTGLLPLIQPPNLHFEGKWASKWETINGSSSRRNRSVPHNADHLMPRALPTCAAAKARPKCAANARRPVSAPRLLTLSPQGRPL
jgi:hypothetical protein